MSDRSEPEPDEQRTVDVRPSAMRRPPGPGEPWDLTGAEVHGLAVRELVGRGGMGEVYKAWDPQLERFVALKVIAAGPGGEARSELRFQREARAASAVRHPNVAQVYFVGVHDRRPFLVMEYVEGRTLEQVVRERGRLSGSRSLDYLIQACEGLEAAHRVGVIHRDIKPGNLMIDRSRRLKIVDFGLARRAAVDVTVTAENTVVGTPAYMSPEQAMGRTLDHRSDIYSLGATFYHALAGRPPFEGETPIEIATQHVSSPVPPLARYGASIPRPVCAVIERMLAKKPEHRFADYDQLLARLRAIRSGSGTGESRVVVSHERNVSLVLPGAVLLAGVLLVGLWLGRQGEDSPASEGAEVASVKELEPSVSPPPSPVLQRADEPELDDFAARASAEPDQPGLDHPGLDQRSLDEPALDDPEPAVTEPILRPTVNDSPKMIGGPEALTIGTFHAVDAALGAYWSRWGTLPPDLAALAAAGLLPSGSPKDGWGAPIHYRREAADRYHIVSPGPDRRPRTADDLFYEDGRVARGKPPAPQQSPY